MDTVNLLTTDVYCLLSWISEKLESEGYDEISAAAQSGGITADELRDAIRNFGERPTRMALGWEQQLSAVCVEATELTPWSIWLPVWTAESGRSDLNLEVTATIHPERVAFRIDDVRVP